MSNTRNKADVEYAVVLAVLNFQNEFMQSHYSHAQVQLLEHVIEVELTRTSPIPAELRLAQAPEGCGQLRQMHRALFNTGHDMLKKRIEEVLGRQIYNIVTDLEPLSGRSTIVIQIDQAIDSSV